jgi:hypothetical protein
VPADRSKPKSLRHQRAALIRWSREDPAENAARGNAGLMRRFEREVDPGGVLAPEERQRRAVAARRAYFLGLAIKSAEARRTRQGAA